MTSSTDKRIPCLDGLRGLAALWVLVGHAHLLTGFRVPVIGEPDLGVDLFIMLSGFLMVFHYQLRQNREPWEAPQTWLFFWVRRFFRIAPLYYVMLIVALSAGPALYDARSVIDAFNGANPQAASRYMDDSIANYATHLTFAFGLIPQYAYRTALPDWSIGLEMQFYAAFPFLMIIIGRLGWGKGVAAIVLLSAVAAVTAYKLGVRFPMPSFLPLKLHVFAAGMLLAGALGSSQRWSYSSAALAMLLVLIPIGGAMTPGHVFVRLCLVTIFFCLVHYKHLPVLMASPIGAVSNTLGNRFFHILGELSYGAYLIHLLVMMPLIAYLIQNSPVGTIARWAITLAVTIPVVYALSAVGHYMIELQGQKIGKALTARKLTAAHANPWM